MTRRRDAALAAVVLAAAVLALVLTDTRPAAVPAGVGGVAVVVAELLLGRHEQVVRTWWERPATQAAGGVLALGAVAAGAVLAPGPSLSAAVGAVVTYLVLLALVAVAAVPPPTAWWE